MVAFSFDIIANASSARNKKYLRAKCLFDSPTAIIKIISSDQIIVDIDDSG